MSIVSSQTNIEVFNNATSLISLLDSLTNLRTSPPSLYLDLEEIKLGRHGSISIISLYVTPTKKTFLIDVHCLGKSTFSTANRSAVSLKTILESGDILKVVFDIRNDSDALFSHYQISVKGIKDLQLMELACRQGSKKLLAGLAKCIQIGLSLSTEMMQKLAAHQRWRPSTLCPREGRADVALLPQLYNVYSAKLSSPGQAFWRAQVESETEARVKLSQSPRYDGHSRNQAYGPWVMWNIEKAREEWNEDVLSEAMVERML